MESKGVKMIKEEIPSDRMKYLKYFCLQYKTMKSELQEFTELKGKEMGGINSGQVHKDSMENQILKKLVLEYELDVIERTAMEVGEDVYKYLLRSVTEGTPFEYLDVPMSDRQFRRKRAEFFKKLDQRIIT